MSILKNTFLLLLTLIAASQAVHVAVLETVADAGVKNKVSLTDRQYLTNVLREQAVKELPATQNYTIMTRENITEMLPPDKSIEDCEGSCIVETGKNIAADYICQARVSSFNGSLTLSSGINVGYYNGLPATTPEGVTLTPKLTLNGGAVANGGAAAEAAGEYVVQSGDTPEKIAKRHNVRVAALMEANNLTEEDAKRLRVGQKLVIPGKGAAPKKGAAAVGGTKGAPAKPAPKKENKPAVRPQARDLEEEDNAPVPAGRVELKRIEIDDGYAVDVPKDMTVEEFSNLADVPVAKLRELNPDMPAKILKKGSTYIIPKN